ncbi:MAG: HDOD domain-containing protein [Gammaproteobacteria bacterium]|nr:HDOD domain-containing protein [Gammaproteobacteria bacterium]
MPLGLKKWLDLLAAKPLPVMNASMLAVKAQMANPNLALTDYADSILDDPALALQLLKKANQSRQSVNREPLTTLSNALSHLGRGQLEQQVAQVQVLDQLGLPEQNIEGYKATVAAACHAASLALDWAQQRKTHEPEEMQLAALLQFLAEMALWCHGGKVMPDIENRCYGQRQNYDQVAEQVLGCSIRALAAALAKAWAMPELVVQSLQVKAQDFTLASGVMLASRLARLAQHSWYDRAARECLDDIARYKGHSLSDIGPQIRQNAVALSGHFIALGLAPPARLLPMLVDEDYIDPKFMTAEARHQAPSPEQQVVNSQPVTSSINPAAEHSRNETAKRSITSVMQPGHVPPLAEKQTGVKVSPAGQPVEPARDKTPAPQPIKDESVKPAAEQKKTEISPQLASKLVSIKTMIKQQVHAGELIQAVVEAIQLSGFDRVVFAVKVPKKKLLYGRFFANGNTDRPFSEFNISVAQPNLFSLLMNKSQHLWINDGNRGKFWSRVPDVVKHMLQNNSFMLMSIFTHKHSVGLMYADRIDGKLTQNEYKRFQGLCRLLVDGMIEISHHQDG